MAAVDASIYEKFIVESADGTRTVDIRQGVVGFVYYENILAPSVTATVIVVNTGGTIRGENGKMQGIYNGLPLRGGERVIIKIAGNSKKNNGLDFSKVDNKLEHKIVTSGCGQGTTFGGVMDDLRDKKIKMKTTKQSTIYHLLKLLHDKNEIYRRSGAVHGCALCDDDKILDFVEDVGRHNAVDAIAGHMWLNNIEGEGKIFYTTGRLTSEMVIKVAQMNISTLLSRSGITEMGLNVAKDTQVTLLGRAKGKHFIIYNGKDNIIFDDMPEPRPDGASDVWKRR